MHNIQLRRGKTKRRTIRTTIGINSSAVDIAVMTKMIVLYIIVNVETRGGKIVRAPAFHQSGQGSTLYTTLYVVE